MRNCTIFLVDFVCTVSVYELVMTPAGAMIVHLVVIGVRIITTSERVYVFTLSLHEYADILHLFL